jgi:hypothetical protein
MMMNNNKLSIEKGILELSLVSRMENSLKMTAPKYFVCCVSIQAGRPIQNDENVRPITQKSGVSESLLESVGFLSE